jgi:uncharacterized protein YbjQ (UPF0145 family)
MSQPVQIKKYDPSKFSTTFDYDKTLYKEAGITHGISAFGVSLSKSLFSSVRAVFGQREINIENIYTDAFDNAILHMMENASDMVKDWVKIVGVSFTLNSPNPETVSCMVQGTIIVRKSTGSTQQTLKNSIFLNKPLTIVSKTLKKSPQKTNRTRIIKPYRV